MTPAWWRSAVTGSVALLGVALAGCGPLDPVEYASTDPHAPPAQARSERFVVFVGPTEQHSPPFLDLPNTNIFALRSLLDRKTGESEHQLFVSDSYNGVERFWNGAHDGQGRPLRFIPIGRDELTCVNGCAYSEEFAAELPDNLMRTSPKGLVVIFTSRTGQEKTILLPPSWIEQQLATFDAWRVTAATPPAATAAANPAQPTALVAAPPASPSP